MKKIAVIGACQGAGATFISSSLAYFMGKITDGVTYVESPQANKYRNEALAINQFSLEKKQKKGINLYRNVNWVFREDGQPWIMREFSGEYIIYDNPVSYKDFDLLICVVDGLPSKTMASKEMVQHLSKYFGEKTLWILNRDYGDNIKNIQRYLGIKFDYSFPMQSQEELYRAELCGQALQYMEMLDEKAMNILENVAKYIVFLY